MRKNLDLAAMIALDGAAVAGYGQQGGETAGQPEGNRGCHYMASMRADFRVVCLFLPGLSGLLPDRFCPPHRFIAGAYLIPALWSGMGNSRCMAKVREGTSLWR